MTQQSDVGASDARLHISGAKLDCVLFALAFTVQYLRAPTFLFFYTPSLLHRRFSVYALLQRACSESARRFVHVTISPCHTKAMMWLPSIFSVASTS